MSDRPLLPHTRPLPPGAGWGAGINKGPSYLMFHPLALPFSRRGKGYTVRTVMDGFHVLSRSTAQCHVFIHGLAVLRSLSVESSDDRQ